MANYQWTSSGAGAKKATTSDALSLALTRYRAAKPVAAPSPVTKGATAMVGTVSKDPPGRPLKSCLKSSSHTQSADLGPNSDVDDMGIIHSLRKGGTPSRAKSTPVLDREGQALRRQNRRRRRQKRVSDPNVFVPPKGILKKTSSYQSMRFMSEPPPPKSMTPRKSVSFTGLSRCRWESDGSDPNLKAKTTAANQEVVPSSKGNFAWGSNQSSKKAATKSLSTSSLSRLRQELSTKKKKYGSLAACAPTKPSRTSSDDGHCRGTNPFQASLEDFQSVLAQSTRPQLSTPKPFNTAPLLPRRQGSFDHEEELLFSRTVLQLKAQETKANDLDDAKPTIPRARQAPSIPNRRGSMEHDNQSLSPVPAPDRKIFQGVAANDFVTTKSVQYRPPSMPVRKQSKEHHGHEVQLSNPFPLVA
ncbi:expressed unknown protein [Seminavis robusta]|uniref:Uncharacterized protein n=1 Tax=Seminavis robusta TaxID=568900 RepID=A0A9N8EAC1_9STRA|nr:expressed unknown protein [Seminavis robusta]|eukprot:Sro722_g192960.1 n/a (416) ;mRNA; f:45058-46305